MVCGMATTVTARRPPLAERVPPHAWFVGSAVFHYLGPAFAVLLFARVGPLGTGWLRIAAAALVLDRLAAAVGAPARAVRCSRSARCWRS